MKMTDLAALRDRFETTIAHWDRTQQNPNAGNHAFIRLEECLDEIKAGKSVAQALNECFDDGLLTALQKAARVY
jgi:hypothetical protein